MHHVVPFRDHVKQDETRPAFADKVTKPEEYESVRNNLKALTLFQKAATKKVSAKDAPAKDEDSES